MLPTTRQGHIFSNDFAAVLSHETFAKSDLRAQVAVQMDGDLRLRALCPQRTAAHPRAAAAKLTYKSFSCGLACAATALLTCEQPPFAEA